MDNSGGWKTEEFGNGRNFQPRYAATTAAAIGGVTPPMYNPPVTKLGGGKGMGIVSMSLRIAQIVFTLISFSLMGANKQTAAYYSYPYYYTSSVTFTVLTAYVFLLSMNVIVCFYSLVQLVVSIIQMCSGRNALSSPTMAYSMITFIIDQVLAYALMAAGAAGAGAAVIIRKGEAGWKCSGSGFESFCNKGDAAVAMTFIAFVCLGASALLYTFRLYRVAKI